MMTSLFRIQNTDGYFSTGGSYPRWSKTGKVWLKLAHVKAHLAMLSRRNPHPYLNASVIEYTIGDGEVVGNAFTLDQKWNA